MHKKDAQPSRLTEDGSGPGLTGETTQDFRSPDSDLPTSTVWWFRYRPRIWHLMVLTALIACAMVLGRWAWSILLIWFVMLILFEWITSLPEKLACVMIGLLFLAFLLSEPVRNDQGTSLRVSCMNCQRQIALAMLNFESAYGKFPDTRLVPTNGGPEYSWRVAILPFLERNDLYEQYDFSEPWDGPNNSRLISKMPDAFRCPLATQLPVGHTQYRRVVGTGTMFEPGVAPLMTRLKDSPGETIMIVEDGRQSVAWLDPQGLSVDEVVELFADPKLEDLPHHVNDPFTMSRSGGSVAMFDGSIRFAGTLEDRSELRKLFGVDDGDASVDEFSDGYLRLSKARSLGVWVSVCFWLVLLGVLSYQHISNLRKGMGNRNSHDA